MKLVKTGSLPGMEAHSIPELTDLGERYADKRDERIKIGKDEKALKTALIHMMKQHSLSDYRDDNRDPPLTIQLIVVEEKVRVRVQGEDEIDDD